MIEKTKRYIVDYIEKLRNIRFYDSTDELITDISNVTTASKITYDMVNNTNTPVNYDLILAVFDKEALVMKEIILYSRNQTGDAGNHAKEVSILPPGSYDDEEDIILAFLWKSDSSLAPLAKQKIIR